jgi:hypothetical protein
LCTFYLNPSWSGESPTYDDWSSHCTERHAHCILIFWRALPYDILVMTYTLCYSCYNLFEKLSCKNLKSYLCMCAYVRVCVFLIVVLSRVYILNVIKSLSCWIHHLIIFFKAHSLLIGHFYWIFRTCFFVVINIFFMSSYVIILRRTLYCYFRWKNLYVNLYSHKYKNLKGNLVYVYETLKIN